MKKHVALFLWLFVLCCARAGLTVPAFTAYLDPADGGARVSSRGGVIGWDDPEQKVLWFGQFKTTGQLNCTVKLRLPAGVESKLRLTVGKQSREVTVKGVGDALTKADFGSFEIPSTGYQQFTLESLNGDGKTSGDIVSLILGGSSVADAHFNLEPRRNSASVHLAYPTQGYTNIDAFYCEVTPVVTPLWTYFEASGWHRGYFGMQVNSPTERRIIFSVWDSGDEHYSRSKVGMEDRVTLVAKGDGVYTGDFGNEGTGGHSHLVYNWKTGEKQRFLVTEKVTDATHSIYSGYWFQPEQQKWMLISSWKAPRDGQYLHGLYSFIEDFNGENGQLNRKAFYGNQWFHTIDGQWHEQTTATFSHDQTGKSDRFDRFMGVENGKFFLSTGGFVSGYTKYGMMFTRPAIDHPPADVALPLEAAKLISKNETSVPDANQTIVVK